MGGRGDWLVGGGEMARLIKAKDWSRTLLGPIERWPQSLRTTVSLVQASSSPISLSWGPGHTQIYNDGYWPICGAKHPHAMGQDFRACWTSTFPVLGEAYATAWSGRSAYLEKVRMFLDRFGFLEETWFTFSFSPIADESGGVGGLFHPVTELTGQLLSERRTRGLRDLASLTAGARTAAEALRLAADVFAEGNLDVPFAVFYQVEGGRARRVAQSGITARAAGPELVELAGATPWSIGEAVRGNAMIELDDVAARLDEPVGPYPELPRRAFVLPLRVPAHAGPVAVVVAGVSARLAVTDAYRVFFELVGGTIGNAVGNARMVEEQHHKAEELAELDRAKTAFFSSVGHEFRTPLTLILGPLEDELAERAAPLPPARRDRIDTAHRNSLRLLKLVNSLLEFSRIEAGQHRASYQPVDLAAETVHLAEVLRSAIERAGLTLRIDCPPLPAVIHVDREMWDKIVLNLMSNALKHTERGGITVALAWHGDHVALHVADTGIGIADRHLPRVFDRFHRVAGAWSRSHEGTGLGLALIRELARLLGGDVSVTSAVGIGSTFSVTIKTGSAHLPAEQVDRIAVRDAAVMRDAFAAEASSWQRASIVAAPVAPAGAHPRVVWADDNADMRGYVAGLLADHFEVVAVADGAEALREVQARLPDLVLSDVMMPNLDGFQLVAALRADPRTQAVPVILVSARAGAQQSVEGLDAGADDYLIKPFAARELIARVRTHVAQARTRGAWAAQLEQTNRELDQANRELELANRELEAFSYSASHDLRAPLRAIDGFCHLLIEEAADKLDGDSRNYLDHVLISARRMRAVIDDLLALSQAGRRALRIAAVDLGAIARGAIAMLAARDPERTVDARVDDGLVTRGDARMLTLVLENLLGNAWKFTHNQPCATILVGRTPDGAFFVRDNGAGFDMADAGHMFEPFHRLHPEHEFEGTGIGLAIVRRIIERHGGRAWATGAINAGATVYFTLAAT